MRQGFIIIGLICIKKKKSRFLKIKITAGETDEETDGKTDKKTVKKKDFTWMHRQKSELEGLLNKVPRYHADGLDTKAGDKRITLGNTKRFLKNINTGKIKNKEEAEREYLKTVFNDKNLLKEKTRRYTDKTKELRDIFDDVQYDIPDLESEESPEQRKKLQNKCLVHYQFL